MHLLVYVITAACFVVVSVILIIAVCSTVASSKSMQNQPVVTFSSDKFLSKLDESLSRCGRYQIDIRELTIQQFQEHFQSGNLTSAELTECYLKRIDEIDVNLTSVIETPDAIQLAKRADHERRKNWNRGLMHGIPILIKDNIGTADSMQTTVGAEALVNLKPKQDAEVVQLLRRNGAIILGKTNPSEWAFFRDRDAPSGWSSRGGQTIFAYVLNQNPSGSSTGSGVSISTNLAAVSLGTETDGSIIAPSARNGLVGLKTTIGKVSTKGVIPLSFSSDVVGPMTRSVQDAAIVLGAISNIDLQGCDVDVSTCLSEKKLKIGVLRDPFWKFHDGSGAETTLHGLEACLNNVKRNKLADVIDPVVSPFPPPDIEQEVVDMIFMHEFKESINNYLKDDVEHLETELGRNISTLADIINYNNLHPPIKGYKQRLLISSNATDGLHNGTYLRGRNEVRMKSMNYLESIFKKYDVDALAAPCQGDTELDLFSYGAYGGFPSIAVPVGVDLTGVPFGLCFLGKFSSEPVLLKLGSFIESSRSTKRHTPNFLRIERIDYVQR